jgi:hypothetical protein
VARIDYIKFRLNNWALWKACESAGGLGFATRSVMFAGPMGGGYRESAVPVDDVDASVTDDGVSALKVEHRQLHDVVHAFYLSKEAGSTVRVGQQLGMAASTVSANLDRADQALSIWFRIRLEKNTFKT